MVCLQQWIHVSAPIKNKVIDAYGLPQKDAQDILFSGKASCKKYVWPNSLYPEHLDIQACAHTQTQTHISVQLVASEKQDVRVGRIEERA